MASFLNSWIEPALTNSTVTRPPPLPSKEPEVVLPKEILVGARKLEPEEIEAAVLSEVAANKKRPTTFDEYEALRLMSQRNMYTSLANSLIGYT